MRVALARDPDYSHQVSDTTPEIAALHAEKHRRMTPAERLQLAFEMSDFSREMALAGIRRRHPGISERDAVRELLRLAQANAPLA